MPKYCSTRIEDYLEAIYSIIQTKGYVRTKDISMELEIKPPSVTEMLNKMKESGLIHYEKYGGITLTEQGKRIGKAVKNRHVTMRRFLKALLISDKIADIDACKLEHSLNPETIEQLTMFVNFIGNSSLELKWREHFKRYCTTGKHARKDND